MLLPLLFLYIYFFTILLCYLLFIYPKLFESSAPILYASVTLNIIATLYLSFNSYISSPLMILASFALIPALFMFYEYGEGKHIYSFIPLSPFLLTLGILTWHPTVIGMSYMLSLFSSSIAYIVLIAIIILVAFDFITFNKKFLAIMFLLVGLPFIFDSIASYIKYGVDGLASNIFLPLTYMVLYLVYLTARTGEYVVFRYLSLSSLIIVSSSALAMDLSGFNGFVYLYEPVSAYLIYYALIPIVFISRKFLVQYSTVLTTRILATRKPLTILLILVLTLFYWGRSILSGLTPEKFVYMQVSFSQDLINYLLPLYLLLFLIYIFDKFSTALGLTLFYLSIHFLLQIYSAPIYSLSLSLGVVLIIAALLNGLRKSSYIYVFLLILIVATALYAQNYRLEAINVNLPIYTNKKNLAIVGESRYALLTDIHFNEQSQLITVSFELSFPMKEFNITLNRYILKKKLFNINIVADEVYIIRSPDVILLNILPDSSLMGSLDYYANGILLSYQNESELIDTIYGMLICRAYVMHNIIYYVISNMILFALPLAYVYIEEKFIGK